MDTRRRISFNVNTGGGQPSEPSTGGTYTVNLNSQWEATTAIPNPDSTLYDGVYRSSSSYNVNNGVSTMYIDISGYSEFTLYIRSYAESNYDYVMVSELDKTITSGSSTTDTTLVKAHTKGNQKSGTTISDYTEVKYTNIDGGSHRITILYRKDSSVNSGDDRGYVLIKKQNASSGDSGGDSGGGDIIVDTNNYMTIYALEDGLQAKLSGNTISYSLDEGTTWTSLASNTYTPTVNSGQTIMFKGNLTPNPSSGIGRFTINKRCNLMGNCNSLLFSDNAASNNSLSDKSYAFYCLFSGCTTIVEVSSTFLPATTLDSYCYRDMFLGCSSLVTAPALPATTLANDCYYFMFYGCTSLVTAPELPATTLASYCYSNMFYSCSSLVNAPELPATTLVYYCYYGMFQDCTSLTTSPELPATTLAGYCYDSMFRGCSSLVNAPELPATTLAIDCYSSMFWGCSSLVTAPELPATILKDYCYRDMFRDCTSLVTAPELPATILKDYCYRDMFLGCSSLVTAPALPATTLVYYCYGSMFYGCTSLVTAPELPATKLASYCYQYMFYGCSKLNYIKMLATNISASNCLNSWVSGVSSTGTFVKHPNMTSLPTGSSGIPNGWTVYNNGEEPERESPQVAGDVAYYTNGEIKTISKDKWSSSLGTPIGVVVIPSNFLPDGKARILSLKAVNRSGNATTSHSSMKWSSTSTDTTLTNYTKVPITNNTGSVSSSSNSYGYLPSDNFTGDTSFVDGSAKYNTTNTTKIPSPYNGNEFNTDYSKTISGYKNALSDFNGLSNTQVLVGLGSDYIAANAAYNYSDGASNIQWYLPSAGELGFLVARFKTINSTISQLGGVAVPSHYFWSSTEYSSNAAYNVYTRNGYVSNGNKGNNNYVRPFASFG